jgi:sugar-specific transcriptional regulator TrmB
MTKSLEKDLRTIGLKKNEIEIYYYLLQNGLSTPPQIAKGTGILRTNCYNILQTLKEKDIIEEQKKGSRQIYLARDPEALKLTLQKKVEAVDRILPDLRALYTTQKNKPSFRFFEGFEEVKQIYDLTLNAEDIYATGSTDKLNELDPKFFKSYIKKVFNKKIIFYDLLPASAKQKSANMIKEITNSLYEARFLPEQYKENLTDLLIWDDNIALIALDEPIFGTVITNKSLAQTFKTLLKIIWEKL